MTQKTFKKKSIFRLVLICLVMTMALLVSACTETDTQSQNTVNSALKSLNLDNQEKGTLAIIKNFPDKEDLDKVPNLTTLKFDDENETLLLLPVHNQSTIEIKNLTWDNGELKEIGTAYRVESTEDGYGLFLTAMRPEGPPFYKMIVTGPEGKVEYLISYNGKDGTPEVETLSIN